MHKVANNYFVCIFVIFIIVQLYHERCDATVINWVGNSQGFWDMKSSWSPAQLPTLDDDVIISNADVTVRDSCFARSLRLEQQGQLELRNGTSYNILNVSIDSSQLTLGHDITIEHLYISGGIIANGYNSMNSIYQSTLYISGDLQVSTGSPLSATFNVLEVVLLNSSRTSLIGDISFSRITTLTINEGANVTFGDSENNEYLTQVQVEQLNNFGVASIDGPTLLTVWTSIQTQIPGNDSVGLFSASANISMSLHCASRF